MTAVSPLNTRILVIDDEESVRDGFRVVLCPKVPDDSAIRSAASVLFGDAPKPAAGPGAFRFEVDTATHGKEGLWMVESALAKGLPYAVIFCDIRMPGWDGVETVEHIRKIDRRAQIAFVTAYGDHSIETVVARAGADVGYFVKPFLSDEVKQLATKLVLDWNKARELEALVHTITSISGETSDIERLVEHLLGQICAWLDTDSAALMRRMPGGTAYFHAGVGRLHDKDEATRLVEPAQWTEGSGVSQLPDGTTFLPLHDFGLAVALSSRVKLTPDRLFLLQAFGEHAALAIRNSEMRTRLREQERLATIGQVLTFVAHDLRGPIGVAQMIIPRLRSETLDAGERAQLLDRLERQIRRTVAIVGDTLDLGRGLGHVDVARVDLAAAIADALPLWHADCAPAGIALAIDVPPKLAVYADPERLDRLLWNLINNAAKALRCVRGARVEVSAVAADGGAEIRVADNGPGVPPALVAWLLDPAASPYAPEGAGFGLAIVKQIMQAHGGRIALEREEGRTLFRLFFPAPADASVPAAA